MQFYESRPHVHLRQAVRCYWTMTSVDAPPSRILPDGCIELVFKKQGLTRRHYQGASKIQTDCFLAGQLKENMILEMEGCVKIVAVRFQPYGLSTFTRIPLGEFTGMDVDFGYVWPSSHLRDELFVSENWADQVGLLDRFFLQAMGDAETDQIRFITRQLQDAQNSVSDVARLANLSMRQLQRLFLCRVGLSPIEFKRICRFQRVVKDLSSKGHKMVDLAYTHHYSDQAHMNREFREFAGIAPQKFQAEAECLGKKLIENTNFPSE
ncbi:MAG: helix-turn-helix transcriptional regulator [Acidobacteria bacterium]|nr:helix-turn-helix transcriptional regulator [Acidobacteriota bacterium]